MQQDLLVELSPQRSGVGFEIRTIPSAVADRDNEPFASGLARRGNTILLYLFFRRQYTHGGNIFY